MLSQGASVFSKLEKWKAANEKDGQLSHYDELKLAALTSAKLTDSLKIDVLKQNIVSAYLPDFLKCTKIAKDFHSLEGFNALPDDLSSCSASIKKDIPAIFGGIEATLSGESANIKQQFTSNPEEATYKVATALLTALDDAAQELTTAPTTSTEL